MSAERLALPTLLEGSFDHAIIGTYGADLVFFEHHLARRLHRIRNKIILLNDLHLGEASRRASDARLRGVNASYLVSPIRSAGEAHQKFILLLGPEVGRLFVGSGNLGFNGYATQGELFCRYDFDEDAPSDLGSFMAVKEFLEGLEERGYLHPVAIRHIRAAWSDTPWIYGAEKADRRSVVHNLDVSLIDQLTEAAAGGGPITEMTVFAPFHDKRMAALRELIKALRPRRTTLLVQEGATSIDPGQLSSFKRRNPSLQVRRAEAEIAGTYLHAKFVLLRQRRRAVCLQGSGNLSVAGILRKENPGNAEMANLLVGPHAEFDPMLHLLKQSAPVRTVESLDLSLSPDEAPQDEGRVYLVGATWSPPSLELQASRDVSEVHLSLRIGEVDCALDAVVAASTVRFDLDEATAELLAQHRTVSLIVGDASGAFEVGPIFPYLADALRSLLNRGAGVGSLLDRTGSLTVEDDDVLALLQELQMALPIDALSIWRIARHRDPQLEQDKDAPRVRWEDLDWERIKRHPRIAQYGARISTGQEPTELQLILDSITNHFRHRGRVSVEAGSPVFDGDDVEPTEAETEEEREEQERRRRSIKVRNRMAWRRFVNRMLDGLSDSEYLDRVGPIVIATNFTILNHLLGLLIARDIIDTDFGIEAQLDLWKFMWGSADHKGLIVELDEEEWALVNEMLREKGAYAMTLAGLYRASVITRVEEWSDDRHIALRDTFRLILESNRFPFEVGVLQMAAAEVLPRGRDATRSLINELEGLARAVIRQEFFPTMAKLAGVPAQQLHLKTVGVQRRGKAFSTEALHLDRPGRPMDATEAARALALWRSLDPERDYYRIDDVAGRTVAVIDVDTGDGWWASKAGGDLKTLEAIAQPVPGWQRRLNALKGIVPDLEVATA